MYMTVHSNAYKQTDKQIKNIISQLKVAMSYVRVNIWLLYWYPIVLDLPVSFHVVEA